LPRIIKFILFLVLFGIVFELGLLSSYTIVTAQPPDVGELMEMQVTKLSELWGSIAGSDNGTTAKSTKVTNIDAVANDLKAKTQLNGINVDTLSATLPDSSTSDTMNVTLTATGYKEIINGGNSTGNASGGQIVIKQSETYSVTATAMAKKKSKGVEVDVNTIQITALKKMYQ